MRCLAHRATTNWTMTKTATCLLALITGLALTGPAFAQEATETPEAPEAADVGTESEAKDSTGDSADGTTDGENETEGSGFEGATEDAGKDGSADGLDVDASALFQTTTGMTYAELLGTLSTVKDSAMAMEALDNMSAGGEVYIVHLSELQGEDGENAAAVVQMTNDRQATMTDLHAKVAENATVRNALQDINLLPGNVVAVHGIEAGRMIVVVDDSPI
jgi:hypothetical protein